MEEDIDIAYDKKRERYVAYSTYTGVFGIGTCVESALENYNDNLIECSEWLKMRERHRLQNKLCN